MNPEKIDNAAADAAGDEQDVNLDAIIGAAFDGLQGSDDDGAPEADTNTDDAPLADASLDASPETTTEETSAPAADEATGVPDRWSAEEKADFAKLPPEAQRLVLKRETEREGAFTRKTQEHAEAVRFSEDVSRVITPEIRQQLAQSGMSVAQGIAYLVDLNSRFTADPAGYFRSMMQAARLDPAEVFGLQTTNPAEVDPFADPQTIALQRELQTIKSEFGALRSQAQNDAQTRAYAAAQASIEAFAAAKDASGNPLRPYFGDVQEDMGHLLRAYPGMSIEDAYAKAVRVNDVVAAKVEADRNKAALEKQRREAVEAKKAGLINVKGHTRTVTPRQTIETAEDAVLAGLAAIGM